MTEIFISRRRPDQTFAADFLYEALTARFGAGSTFLDVRSLTPGRDFCEELWPALEGSSLVVALIEAGWNAVRPDGRRPLDDPDDFVRREITRAFRLRIPVLPVLVLDAQLPSAEHLPEEIARLSTRQAVTLRPESVVGDLARLRDAAAAVLRGDRPPGTALPPRQGRVASSDGSPLKVKSSSQYLPGRSRANRARNEKSTRP